jgi:hypothetical protein
MNRRRAYLLLGALVLAGILALRWFQGVPELPSRTSQVEQRAPDRPEPSEESRSEAAAAAAGIEASGSPDSAIKSAEGPQASGSRSVQVEQKAEPVEPTPVERVLSILESRDLAEIQVAMWALMRCQNAPITEQDWENSQLAIENMKQDPEGYPPGFIENLENSEAEWRKSMADCRALHELRFGAFFYEDLHERAANGDPFARFIYSMWTPNDRSTVLMSGDSLLAFETNALAFTLDNLDEGHPLGLLAMGLSYTRGGYFTPRRQWVGTAFMIAAQLCSGGELPYQRELDRSLERLDPAKRTDFNADPSVIQVLEAGARLHDAYCATALNSSAD